MPRYSITFTQTIKRRMYVVVVAKDKDSAIDVWSENELGNHDAILIGEELIDEDLGRCWELRDDTPEN